MRGASLPAGLAVPPAGATAGSTAQFNLGLQGMRGIAILLVLLNHASVPGFGGGYVGVDVFFVISGYLIGGLLMRELDAHGRIDLWAFFARRVRRLLPASALVLVCTLIGVRFLYAPQEQDELLSSIRAASLYAINLWFSSRPTDYFGGHTEANPALHLWSLAVEEQFYVLWPLLMLAFAKLTRRDARATTAWLLVVLGVLSFIACLLMSLVNYKYAFFLTPFRIWEFAVGMAVMCWAPRAGGWSTRALTWLGVLALVLLIVVTLSFGSRLRFPGFWAAFPVLATAALLLVVQRGPATPAGRWLEMRWLCWLGDCSYSLYLWHWPVLIAATQFVPQPNAGQTMVLLGLCVILGRLSYRWVEQPFMHSLGRHWSPRRVLAAGMLLCVAIAGGTQAVRKTVHIGPEQERYLQAARWDSIDKTGCLTLAQAEDQPPCVFGDAGGTTDVVLFGDSHAAQWFGPLNQFAVQHGMRLVMLTKAACPSVDVPVKVYTTLADYRECAVWRERMFERIHTLKPRLIVLANSSGHTIPPAVWQAGLGRTLGKLQPSGARIAYLQDIPFPGFDVPVCHARAAWRGWSPEHSCTYLAADEQARLAPLARAEADAVVRQGGTFIDLTPAICAGPVCETARDGMVFFKDRNHLSEAFALHLQPALALRLAPLVAPPAAPAIQPRSGS